MPIRKVPGGYKGGSQMGSQLTGNKVKKTKKMNTGGQMSPNIDPSMVSPTATAAALALLDGVDQGGGGQGGNAAALRSQRPMLPQRPMIPAREMKRGGKVRGDGVCQRGHTKGTMR